MTGREDEGEGDDGNGNGGEGAAARPRLRLWLDAPLAEGAEVPLSPAQTHYLVSVMRRGPGDAVALFNGRDGEWRARLATLDRKRGGTACLEVRMRPPHPEPGPWLLIAPVKRQALDLTVEKATELGAGRLLPVLTRRTNSQRVKTDRLRAIATEAAEQCGRLTVPEVAEPQPLPEVLADWPAGRRLLLLDETGGGRPLGHCLERADAADPVAFLVGPEGGFDNSELDAVRQLPFVQPVDLGPRILRAETAALAALAAWQVLAAGRGGLRSSDLSA
ncbi:16S rRNA (uracil(1498)-N(3))-methyltransferase [Roseospirillum parvum]|uniref:Ribosomal RNA small subunit methyltransferase E n=1 Tax=Roseospirillum parvum TaxID=83401 RepID=A0A1G8CHI4_9PROT|nr:16S rRNA (uracil(1498)-N(3))-methyltransferase [Roseospirillum parvum]SDH44858.1 16S rRNA (uracil1498-N3)-methyltransferase [Roseospirillum parvum]